MTTTIAFTHSVKREGRFAPTSVIGVDTMEEVFSYVRKCAEQGGKYLTLQSRPDYLNCEQLLVTNESGDGFVPVLLVPIGLIDKNGLDSLFKNATKK